MSDELTFRHLGNGKVQVHLTASDGWRVWAQGDESELEQLVAIVHERVQNRVVEVALPGRAGLRCPTCLGIAPQRR